MGHVHYLAVTPDELEEQDIEAARLALAKVNCGDFGDLQKCCQTSLSKHRPTETGKQQQQKGGRTISQM
jgi:hypothetical protein